MQPIVTPAEMRAIDAAADAPQDVLIGRAGAAVTRAALAMLGGAYGRRVAVIAGTGNNGADGRVAARLLTARGVRVQVVDAAGQHQIPAADLVIDAAYGTGFHGTWQPPAVAAVPVLAVDVPSGVDALTGLAAGQVLAAARTVTFQAWKPGLLFGTGPDLAGTVEVADIGLGATADRVLDRRSWLVQQADAAGWWPVRERAAHKWRAAVRVVAGGPGMTGAACLAAGAAQRGGAGMVQLVSPTGAVPGAPVECVQLTGEDWAAVAVEGIGRVHALAVGPGLGRAAATVDGVRRIVAGAPVPLVVDGDGLFAVAGHDALLRARTAPTVLTPHDGEYERLTGAPPDADRLAAARRLAATTGAVVVLKGPATVVADPGGTCYVIAVGDQRLATAGSGDVLTGLVAAALAAARPSGNDTAARLAAAAVYVHGATVRHLAPCGVVAGDLVGALPAAVAALRPDHRP